MARVLDVDTKTLKKVHQTVKGTAFDFADEFDDEFGVDQPKEPEVSLKDLREQSKRTQNVPIYMKGKATSESLKDDDDFDDEDDVFDSIVDKKPPSKKPSAASKRPKGRAAAAPPPPARGRGRGGRGRPPKKGKNYKIIFF